MVIIRIKIAEKRRADHREATATDQLENHHPVVGSVLLLSHNATKRIHGHYDDVEEKKTNIIVEELLLLIGSAGRSGDLILS